MSPLFDQAKFHAFVDDNHVIETNKSLVRLIEDMKMKIEMMTKWMKDSGLMVNEDITEICIY